MAGETWEGWKRYYKDVMTVVREDEDTLQRYFPSGISGKGTKVDTENNLSINWKPIDKSDNYYMVSLKTKENNIETMRFLTVNAKKSSAANMQIYNLLSRTEKLENQ